MIALDGSSAMIAEASARFADEPRVELVVADLTEPLPLDEPVDAILSTATFHWITDHASLFRNLASVLRSARQLVAQCGGAGNISSLERIISGMGHTFGGGKTFATAEETRARLEAAGFEDIDTWLNDEPTPIRRRTSKRSWRPCAWVGSSTAWATTNARTSSTRSHPGCPNR